MATAYWLMARSLLSIPSSRKLLDCSRAPLTVMEPPCVWFCEPFTPWFAPGTSRLSWRKLRPLSGNSVTFLLSTTLPTVAESVLTTGALASTATTSVTWPTVSVISMRRWSSTRSSIPLRSALLKFGSSTTRLYKPAGSCGIEYSPSSLVSSERVSPVATSRAVTLAFRITAPDVSVIVPRMVPRTVCAGAEGAARKDSRSASNA